MKAVIARLIEHYGFEVSGGGIDSWVAHWLDAYASNWVRLATIEALYQGRYKIVSIDWILHCWERRGYPNFHFNAEFERLICRRLPRDLRAPSPELTEAVEAFAAPSLPAEAGWAEAAQPASEPAEAAPAMTAERMRESPPVASARSDRSQPPIHQFSPSPDRSGFYAKLKAVAASGHPRR